jgi:hypothetical protein
MGPHRIIHNRRGYLTETCFDTESGRFYERLFPPTVRMEPRMPSSTIDGHKPAPPKADLDGLTASSSGLDPGSTETV